MNILMIGNQGSGKTTYMASTYGILQKPVDGFTLKADTEENHRNLINLFKQITHNKYPSQTQKRDVYKFSLLHNKMLLLDFSWKDYRGGILRDSSNNESELQDFINDLNEADAILLFFDSSLVHNNTVHQRDARRIMNLITEYLKPDKEIPIILLLTKIDIALEMFSYDVAEMMEKVKDSLGKFSAQLEMNKNFTIITIPIQCSDREILHVDFPILLLMLLAISNEYEKVCNQINSLVDSINYLRRNSGIFDTFFSRLIGAATNGELADMKLVEMQKKKKVFENLHDTGIRLERYLNDYQFFQKESTYSCNDNSIFSL